MNPVNATPHIRHMVPGQAFRLHADDRRTYVRVDDRSFTIRREHPKVRGKAARRAEKRRRRLQVHA